MSEPLSAPRAGLLLVALMAILVAKVVLAT